MPSIRHDTRLYIVRTHYKTTWHVVNFRNKNQHLFSTVDVLLDDDGELCARGAARPSGNQWHHPRHRRRELFFLSTCGVTV